MFTLVSQCVRKGNRDLSPSSYTQMPCCWGPRSNSPLVHRSLLWWDMVGHNSSISLLFSNNLLLVILKVSGKVMKFRTVVHALTDPKTPGRRTGQRETTGSHCRGAAVMLWWVETSSFSQSSHLYRRSFSFSQKLTSVSSLWKNTNL